MQLLDYLVVGLVLALFVLALRSVIKNRKKSCNGSCSGCPYADSCGKTKTWK